MIKQVQKLFGSLLLLLLTSNFCLAQSIFINEIMASNNASIEDNAGNHSDWIELYNPGNSSVDLAGYYISDDLGNLQKFRFTNLSGKVVIPAHGYLIIWASNNPDAGYKHTSFALSASGESISLSNASGTLIDSFTFGTQRVDVSFGRLTDGSGTLKYFYPASPGAANNQANSYNEFLSPPVFSRSGGFFNSPFSLSITHTDPGVTIYYTIDGSIPTTNTDPVGFPYKNSYPQFAGDESGPMLYNKPYQSNLYNAPISITDRSSQENVISQISSTYDKYPGYLPASPIYKGTVVRAIAVKTGALASEVATSSYFYSATGTNKFTFPVISIAVQSNHLFDYYSGIYTAGYTFENMIQGGGSDFCNGNYANRGQAWERPGNFEMIVGANSVLNKTMGIRINGACTRSFRSKSLRIYGDEPFDYPIFSESPGLFHNNLVLRNSGQDFGFTMFKDAFYQSLVSHFRIDSQASQPSVIFLNGEYWGILNVRERFDNDYIETVYGVDKDSLDMLEISGVLIADEGTTADYDNLMAYLETNSPSNTSNYNYVKTKVDINNLIDYQIAQIFTANTDWPQNNQALWRKRLNQNLPNAPYGHDGRWRWMLFDTDFGLGGAQPVTHNTLDFASQYSDNNLIFYKLLQNTEFKNSFINRFADMLNTTYLPSRTTGALEAYKQKYSPEMPAHINRWKYIANYATWESNVSIINDFLSQRSAYQREHIRNKFATGGEFTLTVDVSDPTHGFVRVNTITIDPATPGVSNAPYPWNGSYFDNIPLTIAPVARLGYRFKHWEYNNTIITDSVLTITTSSNKTYKAVFEEYILSENPTPLAASLAEPCGYTFKNWSPEALAGSFPQNMKFVFMNQAEPTLTSVFENVTSGAYNLASKTRISGHGDDGFSFINTDSGSPNPGYPNNRLGGAILAINTTGQSKVQVTWTGRTMTANPRKYRIRLQYRIGDILPFVDLLNESNQPIEYISSTTGSNQTFTHTLPAQALNQPYVQLMWKYYHVSGGSGARDQLGIDDILVETELNLSGNAPSGSLEYKATEISSLQNISNANLTQYRAAKSILLNPGFRTSSNVFVAQVQSCP